MKEEKEGMNKNLIRQVIVLLSLLASQLACGAQPTLPPTPESTTTASPQPTSTFVPATATSVPSTATATVVPTPTLSFEVPTPASGKGTLVGDILWNSQPAVKSQVKLCGDFHFYYGCKGLEYSASTNEQGYYLIENVEPGEYTLLANLFGTSWYLYSTEKVNIKADKVSFEKPFHLYKLDLEPIFPANAKTVDITKGNPTMEWKEYPGAAYYEITVDTYFVNAAIREKVETNSFALTDNIQISDCGYSWSVIAYNADGFEISEFKEEAEFSIVNSGASCSIAPISPKGDEKVTGGQVTVSWEPNSLADYYVVYFVTEDKSSDIFSNKGGTQVDKNTTSYSMSNVTAGKYIWAVDAYDASGNQVATSGLVYFSVTNP